MINYVVGFMISTDRKYILLIEKKRPEWQKDKLNGIGGKVEYYEDPDNCIIREFKEETGVSGEKWREFCILSGQKNPYYKYRVHFYVCFSGQIFSAKSQTDEKIFIFPLEAILNTNSYPILYNIKWLLHMALDENIVRGQCEELFSKLS